MKNGKANNVAPEVVGENAAPVPPLGTVVPAGPKWSIMILTQPNRERYLARLLAVLKPQIETHPDIEIVTRSFDEKLDLGTNRQCMIENANGQYVNFIDDDDLVPADYVSTIYPLLDGVDYIGFQLQFYIDGVKQKPTFHSLRYKEWNSDQDGFYRDLSHVNPIRRELAILAPLSGGFGEDSRWSDALRAKGVVKTEHYVDSVMYLYYWRSDKESAPSTHPGSSRTTSNQPQRYSEPLLQAKCPNCNSQACAMAGGMRHCNQCGHSF